MAGRSKSTLFLMEQLVVIAVFAICAAVCVYILAVSYLMTVDAVDTRNALLVAESAAEMYKAFDGDVARIAELKLDDHYPPIVGNSFVIHYCADWLPTVNGIADMMPTGNALVEFVLQINRNPVESGVQTANITVNRVVSGGNTPTSARIIGDELINLTVGVRRVSR